MKPLRINIVLPFITSRPNGGVKIMYEYANRLRERGHLITVIHSIKRPYRPIKSPVWWKQFLYRMKGMSRPAWFPLHESITSLVVPEVTDRFVPEAEITMSTWWEMTYMISRLSENRGKKFNLIQDYETWKGHEQLVHESYKLVNNLVIARYLQELVKQYSREVPVYIPNAIDLIRFQLKNEIQNRNPESIIMLYSEEPRKGTLFGLEVLNEVKNSHPGLTVQLFGVYDKPSLPGWIKYAHRPADLSALMNENAIFFSPSLGEGWALPPAEAMASGCAVVCTDIGGHADYALPMQTALLAEPRNTTEMKSQLQRLLDDVPLRVQLAREGHRYITTQFSWEASLNKMEAAFFKAL